MSFVHLDLCDGPPCAHCGCRDVRIMLEPRPLGPDGKDTWWPSGRAVCNHCRVQFAFRELPPEPEAAPVNEPVDVFPDPFPEQPVLPGPPESIVIPPRDTAYPVRSCPQCGSPATEVVSSGKKPPPGQPRIRYHRCRDCGERFKSVDRRHLESRLKIVS